MTTATLWLLVVYGQLAGSGSPTMVVERSADRAECERVVGVMRRASRGPTLQCVQATIVITR